MTPPSRALFDLVAVAVIKNPDWGEYKIEKGLLYSDNEWQQTESNYGIGVWENFQSERIINDFFDTMNDPVYSIE